MISKQNRNQMNIENIPVNQFVLLRIKKLNAICANKNLLLVLDINALFVMILIYVSNVKKKMK